MLIRVGFSADPDDAFMFWGLASGTVDPRGFEFEPVIEDIQTLNEWSLEGRLEVTAPRVDSKGLRGRRRVTRSPRPGTGSCRTAGAWARATGRSSSRASGCRSIS